MALAKLSVLASRLRPVKTSGIYIGRRYDESDDTNPNNTDDYRPRHAAKESE